MTNQIIEVPDIAVVKTVDGAKKLFSLRDQKIKKETLHDFGNGAGVKYNEDLYVLDSGIIPIVQMTTSKINPSFIVTKSGDIEVDWGDGTREKNVFSHTYSDGAAEHEIVFYGGNTALTQLHCHHNQLTALNVDKNTALTGLYCDNNQLATLNVDNNTALTQLHCYNNQLTALNVDKNTALTGLVFHNNQLTALNVDNNTALTELVCDNNQLAALNVGNNMALTWLGCHSNQLTALNVDNNIALTRLDCNDNHLTALNVDNNIALTELDCYNNQLTALNVGKNTALTWLDCRNNPFITEESALIILANSLPQREENNKGSINIKNATSVAWIKAICDVKNWTIT